MGFVYLYRLGSLVLASFAAIIVIILCAIVTKANGRLQDAGDDIGRLHVSIQYANTGFAAAAITLVSVPIMIGLDFLDMIPVKSIILVELPWTLLLSILFVATGGTAFNDGNFFKKIPGLDSCDNTLLSATPDIVTLCKDSKPIGIVAFAAAGIFFVYTVVLAAFTWAKLSRDSSAYKTSVMECEKL
ncbi:hypothetical protein C8Q80DRAFT_1273451 [Daedaleopsis nitida]|nr:hypothetical protein C8Q80DRAFT_1273451 [Daedaleopsis nitida]